MITALEATVSVLLILAYGAFATRYFSFLSQDVVKSISQVASNVFLPSLIFTEMGENADPKELRHLWILPAFNIGITAISLIYAYIGIKLFKLPQWTATAITFPNLISLPLLLVETLSVAGALDKLLIDDKDDGDDALSRAKIYLLITVCYQLFCEVLITVDGCDIRV
jgi:predicted permease